MGFLTLGCRHDGLRRIEGSIVCCRRPSRQSGFLRHCVHGLFVDNRLRKDRILFPLCFAFHVQCPEEITRVSQILIIHSLTTFAGFTSSSRGLSDRVFFSPSHHARPCPMDTLPSGAPLLFSLPRNAPISSPSPHHLAAIPAAIPAPSFLLLLLRSLQLPLLIPARLLLVGGVGHERGDEEADDDDVVCSGTNF